MKHKITFITGSMGRGGAERVISILSKHYADQGWNVDIVMLLHSHNDYLLDKRVNVVDLSSRGGIKKNFLKTLRNLRSYFKRENSDISVCFMAQNCLLTGLATIGLKNPIVMSERIDPASVKRNILYRFLLNRFYANSAKVIFQTERAKRYFKQEVQDNGCIIGNPISVHTERKEDLKHRIVTAGRMTHQKNQAMLISAFSKIVSEHPEYTLTIYGDGPLKSMLSEQVKKLGLEEKVELPGNVLDLHEQISDAEVFVLPSDFEGLSNALLEAMMIGLPVITTDCAGCDEVIQDGRNGIMIHVGDEAALVTALNKVINDKNLQKMIAINGKESVQRFSVGNIINEWEYVITGAIENKNNNKRRKKL